MTEMEMALGWQGRNFVLTMFVSTRCVPAPPVRLSGLDLGSIEPTVYELEDLTGVLGDRHLYSYDFESVAWPSDLGLSLSGCLSTALRHGADIAWFAFEGSFHFVHLACRHVAPQIYAIADTDGVHVALESDARKSKDWACLVDRIGRREFGPEVDDASV